MNTPTINFAFDTADLVEVVPTLLTPQTFFLDHFFPRVTMSDTRFVAIDVIIGKRRMAPFVSPRVEGKLVEARRVQTNVFEPPYIKDKRAPDLLRPVQRMPGERLLGGEMSGEERMMANLAFEMQDQVEMIQRRLEWMAVQAVLTGTVTVAGDGFPTTTIDFGRDSSMTVALTGGAQWGQAGVSPVSDLEVWMLAMLKLVGIAPDWCIMTQDAFDLFIADVKLQGAVLYPVWNPYDNRLNPGPQVEKGIVQKGQWGQLKIVVYNDWYVDDSNTQQPMLPAGTVILAAEGEGGVMGIRAFAQILDPDFNYEALQYAPKTWTTKDPAQLLIMMQSAPLVIPGRPNATFAATVHT
jgi:hypothetical protein